MATTPLDQLGRSAITAKGWLQAHKWLLLRRASQLGILALFLAGPLAGLGQPEDVVGAVAHA